MRTLLFVSLSLAFALVPARHAHGVSYVLTNFPPGAYWTNTALWTPAGYPNAPGDTADFPAHASNTAQFVLNIDQSVTVGVMNAHDTAGEYMMLTKTGGAFVFSNAAGPAQLNVINCGGTLSFRLQALCMLPQELQISNTTVLSTEFVPMDFQGSAAMHKWGAGSWLIGGPQPNYSGTIHVHQALMHLRVPVSTDKTTLTNATVRVYSGATLVARQNVRVFADLVFESGSTLVLSWANNEQNQFFGDIIINGAVTFTSNNNLLPPKYLGDVRGSGRIILNGTTVTNLLLGSISPGASVGILTLVRTTSAVNYLGTASDRVTLNAEITGAGGVPGIDYDQLVVSNFNNQVDLSTIDLNVTGVSAPGLTNWILTCANCALMNGSLFNSVSAPAAAVVYDYPANRVGITLVPEPAALALLALAGAAALLWRR